MAPRFVFDVTDMMERARDGHRPVGIPRVQMEAAAIMAAAPQSSVEFCLFDDDRRVYERVGPSMVLDAAERLRGFPEGADGGPLPRVAPSAVVTRAAVKRAAVRLVAPSPAVAEHVRKFGSHVLGAVSEARLAVGVARAEHRSRRRPLGCASLEWGEETTYCSLGSEWIKGDLEYLDDRRRATGFRVVTTLHDLTPIVTPQYHGTAASALFDSQLRKLLRLADVVLVISSSTGRDLESFADAAGLPVPEVVRLPLGSDLIGQVPTVPVQMQDVAQFGGRFVLTVGTIEIRKNLQLLLDVWEMLVAEHGSEPAPWLVVAGQRGWLADEAIARLTRTPSLRGVVRFVEGPTDAELAWLYRNCEFTVYPALYEGWGLPVTESLDFEKMCLVSSGSSLEEASEGLTELLDPFDRMAWKQCIQRYWADADLRTRRELEIRRRHTRITGHDTAQVVLDLARR